MLTVTTILFFTLLCCVELKKVDKTQLIERVNDVKEFKKLLRTRNNVLTVFANSDQDVRSQMQLYGDLADALRGLGTVALVDCSSSKKLCKKMKASPVTLEIKHYKDGEFHKDYDRMNTFKSMKNFMLDPAGDSPWDEDSSATSVAHLDNKSDFNKLMKQKKPTLVMFYAPWCGHCKKLKPDYALAAEDLQDEGRVLAAIDLNKPENNDIKAQFNISGFPTLLYFENGKERFKFGGKNEREGIVSWMRDPQPYKEPEPEKQWSDEAVDIVHLLDDTFDKYIATHPSVLVMFYAPWCGHCKKMKPEFEDAAQTLKDDDDLEGVLAAVDATIAQGLGKRFEVKGYPTVKYFKDGEMMPWEMSARTADAIVSFMEDPKEPPPPPPPEPAWSESEDRVSHLNDENFKTFIKKKKHTIVMFYAPWCGHCKKAKPEFANAAGQFESNNKVAFAGIDCTVDRESCQAFDVSGYPTFVYFNYGQNSQKYTGGREEADFVTFMNDPLNPLASAPPPPPSPTDLWADIEGAEHVKHLTETSFDEFIQEHQSVLVMFYAPWCGHCKSMKPAYGEAATILAEKGEHVIAAVDATAERDLQSRFEVTGFPSIKYFKNGEYHSDYDKPRNTVELVKFLDPSEDGNAPPAADAAPPATEVEDGSSNWADIAGGDDISHLTNDNFDTFISEHESVLVMFYAPWCGHCKNMKPAYGEAAHKLALEKHAAKIAAVDATLHRNAAQKYEVKGYPTLKYFKNGKLDADYSLSRTADDFVKFLKSGGTAAAPPPVVETPWSEEAPEVLHLSDGDFKSTIADNSRVLVMFYAPWCGHCKRAKPDYATAAKSVNAGKIGKLAAIDCTLNQETCKGADVKGYPTFLYYENGKFLEKYTGGRTTADFIAHVTKEKSADKPKPDTEEPTKKEPTKKEPTKKEPTKKEPVKEEPIKKEPVKKEPASDKQKTEL